jgi:hypothetical protein
LRVAVVEVLRAGAAVRTGQDAEAGEITAVNYMPKTILTRPYIEVRTKGGLLRKSHKFYKDDFSEVAVIDEEQVSSDGAQRAKNAAIGVVLLGPIGLLGAALGGAKNSMKLRFIAKHCEQWLVEVKPKQCEEILRDLMGIDLKQALNAKLLKSA